MFARPHLSGVQCDVLRWAIPRARLAPSRLFSAVLTMVPYTHSSTRPIECGSSSLPTWACNTQRQAPDECSVTKRNPTNITHEILTALRTIAYPIKRSNVRAVKLSASPTNSIYFMCSKISAQHGDYCSSDIANLLAPEIDCVERCAGPLNG